MVKQKISFRPYFSPPIDKDSFTGKDSVDVRNQVGTRGKKNIGAYFVNLIASINGGYTSGEIYNQESSLAHYNRNFRPDILVPGVMEYNLLR